LVLTRVAINLHSNENRSIKIKDSN